MSTFARWSLLSVAAVLVALGAVLVPVAKALNTQCSDDDDACVQDLRHFLARTDWWFGDSYSSVCPGRTSETTYACRNPDLSHKSIISRVLQDPSFDVQKIKHFLHIRFYVPAGSYRACGHRFDVPAAYMSQDLEVSEDASLDSWSMQTRPAVTWNPDPGAVYTLAAFNVDLVKLSGLWINIRGGDSALGFELSPYIGPLSALNRTSFHVFLLLRQRELISDGQVDVAKETFQDRRGIVRTNLSELQDLVGQPLEPVGAGLVPTGADPYGIESHKSLSLYNNCPWLLARMRPTLRTILEVHSLTALGADPSNLEVEVEVRYTSTAATLTACCQNASVSARTLQLDALSLKPVSPIFLRYPPFVRLGAVNMINSVFFFDRLYTILLLDVTWAIVSPGQRQTLLLWQVADIPGQYVTSGLEQKAYSAPMPPPDRDTNSLYTFFVFRQNSTFMNYTVDKYCSTSTRTGDCDFNLNRFVLDNQLHLSGVNWFWSRPDLYSRLKLYESDAEKMDAACRGVTGYNRPCPDKCTPQVAPTTAPDKATTRPAGGTNIVSANCALTWVLSASVLAAGSVSGRTSWS